MAESNPDMPLGHLGINVPDLMAARTYYDPLMPLLGYEPFRDAEDEFSYRPAGGRPGTYVFFYPALEDGSCSRHQPGLQHLAFVVGTRAAVHHVHDWALSQGGEILHPPQEFPQYHPGYYATFWLDPHGIMLEAVCQREEQTDG